MGRRERGSITPYEFQSLRKTYTIREIAEMKGYTECGLLRWCYRNNVITRRVTDWEIAEEIKNKTPKEIASEYNVSLKVVYWSLKKMGINKKNKGGQNENNLFIGKNDRTCRKRVQREFQKC